MQKRFMKVMTLCWGMAMVNMAWASDVMPLIDLEKELQKTQENAAHKPAATQQAAQTNQIKQASQKPQPKSAPSKTTAKKHSVKKAHWRYEGLEGPAHWGDLDPKFIVCKIGRNQSPINLMNKKAVSTVGLPGFDVYYREVPLRLINNGHTLQVNYPPGSYIMMNGNRYDLLQFHFHTPSEHQKNGLNYPMEMHLVHQDGEGHLAVIGILFQEGETHDGLADIIRYLPKDVGKQRLHKFVKINPVDYFPKSKLFYKYSGSLTTPPCSEGVYWMVFKEPIEASPEQLAAMHALMGDNNRPVQPVYSRSILKSWNDTRPLGQAVFPVGGYYQ